MELGKLLEQKYQEFNQPGFIADDPVSIPHRFEKLQDIEITAFFASMLAWGQRVTIINKCNELIALMDEAPHDFILNHSEEDLKKLLNFKHRTFNTTDTLYFVEFLKHHYQLSNSLEEAFWKPEFAADDTIERMLMNFHTYFFSLPDAPDRTRKHVATPARKSACKRLSMYLRWMVRSDERGVDFGLWKKIKTSQLICPCDVHVEKVGRQLGLIQRKPTDWKTAVELTTNLKAFDPNDPVKYDFALFGMGLEQKVKLS